MNCMNIMKILVYTKDQSLKNNNYKVNRINLLILENSIKFKSPNKGIQI